MSRTILEQLEASALRSQLCNCFRQSLKMQTVEPLRRSPMRGGGTAPSAVSCSPLGLDFNLSLQEVQLAGLSRRSLELPAARPPLPELMKPVV